MAQLISSDGLNNQAQLVVTELALLESIVPNILSVIQVFKGLE